jgi:Fe-S oxidoreductase
MARMKIEFLHHYRAKHGWRMKDRIVANLPRMAPLARRLRGLMRLRNHVGWIARMTERLSGFSARRSLPVPSAQPFQGESEPGGTDRVTREVVLFVDTFSRWFEPENARAAVRVLAAAGYTVRFAAPRAGGRPLCCGRTYLAAGMVDEARIEARRTLEALAGAAGRGAAIVGLEPSCLLTLRDEFPALLPGEAARVLAERAMLFEDFLARERRAGRLELALRAIRHKTALLHGHCHQKAFGEMPAVLEVLALVPELETTLVESSCCGMAGSFGYETEHYEVSQAMAERALLPAIRAASPDALIVTDGTSCRHQIAEGAGREALHVARVLELALAEG